MHRSRNSSRLGRLILILVLDRDAVKQERIVRLLFEHRLEFGEFFGHG